MPDSLVTHGPRLSLPEVKSHLADLDRFEKKYQHLMDGINNNLELNSTFGHLQRKVKQIEEEAAKDPQLEKEPLLFLLRDVEELDNKLEKGIIKHCEKGIENFRNVYHDFEKKTSDGEFRRLLKQCKSKGDEFIKAKKASWETVSPLVRGFWDSRKEVQRRGHRIGVQPS
ncbi:MAG: hypothetical protein Q9192_003749 [Flavoplaca navasiana]